MLTKSNEQTLNAVLVGRLYFTSFQYFTVIGIVQQSGINAHAVTMQVISIKIFAMVFNVDELSATGCLGLLSSVAQPQFTQITASSTI